MISGAPSLKNNTYHRAIPLELPYSRSDLYPGANDIDLF